MNTTKLLVAAMGTMAFAVPALADDTTTTTTTTSAQQQCRTELTQMGRATFAQTYGTHKNKANAFGKCVSERRAATDTARTEAKTNAAKTCKGERAADPAAFKAKYATNKHKANAFGKCVSETAKAQADQTDDTQTDSTTQS